MAQSVQYYYNPPPNEMPLYEALFTAADKQSAGYITGHAAVEFLSLSKLPVDLLKTIWTMADSPPNNMLDKSKFIVAVRLIQLFQNGKRPMDNELRLGQGEVVRAPFFEGVLPQQEVMGSPQPPQQQQQPAMQPSMPSPQPSPLRPQQTIQLQQYQQPSSLALITQDPYAMIPAEQSRYSTLFPTYASEGYVYGPSAVELFSKSGMDREQLKSIWGMCDVPVDNKLDLIEFCVAMHLIVCVTKKGLALPDILPGSLREALEGRDRQLGQAGQSVIGQTGQQLQTTATPASPEGIPSPDKMGMHNPSGAHQGVPHPPIYGQQQVNGVGQSVPYQQNQMGGQIEPQQFQPGSGAIGGETVNDAFAGLSNSPVEDVDEYSTIGGMSTMSGGMLSMQNTAAASQPVQTQQTVIPTQQQPQISQPVSTPFLKMQKEQNFAPASPTAAVKSNYEPSSPARSHVYSSPKPTRKDQQEDEEFNSELQKLRSAHQKLQAEVISLRAKANLFSNEEQEAQSEIRQLAADIADLSVEFAGLKDQVAESKTKLADSLVMLKTQKEKKESLETAIKDTREMRDSLAAATEAVVEANEAMIREHAHTIAATAKAAEIEAVPTETPAAAAEKEDLFSWDTAPAHVPPVTQTQSGSRGIPDNSGGHWGTDDVSPQMNRMPDISHSHGPNWGAENTSITGDQSTELNKVDNAHSVNTSHTSNNGYQYAAHPANPVMQPAHFGNYPTDQQSVEGYAALQPAPVPDYSIGADHTTAMVTAPSSGGYDYGMDLMGMGAPISEAQPAAFHASVPAPVPLQNVSESPIVAEVGSIKREAANAEKSFRQSKELVDTLSEQVQNLEMKAKQAEETLYTAEKKKGSFGAKSKKKKEVAAAQEYANAERQKVEEARRQLELAKKEAESMRKLAEELRHKSEQAEMEAVTAASMQTANQPNGYDHYGGGMTNIADGYGGAGLMGGGQNQGGYHNPFAMG